MTAFATGPMIERMAAFPAALRAVVGSVDRAGAAWKPDTRSWSVLEIVCHLADEEEFDFRVRVRSALDDPQKPWAGIDPEGWALEHGYAERDLGEELERFERERAASIEWLRSLPADAPWDNVYRHPEIGDLRAGDVMAAWGAHDALHLRQIARRLHQLAQRDAGAYSTEYAGEW